MTCRACGEPHPALMRCEVWARQNAINKDAINRSAINAGSEIIGSAAKVVGVKGVERCKGLASEVSPKTANGRSKEAYNAYMREYMKRRRAGI